MNDSLNKFAKLLDQNKLDGFIVTNPTNIFYLTGFRGISPTEREAILVIANHKATLITARLYQNEAKLLASAKLKIKIASERNQIFEFVKNQLLPDKPGLGKFYKPGLKTRRIGFEQNDLTFGEYQEFKKFLSKPRLVPVKNLVENLRAVKSTDEIKKIERAQIISQKAFEQILKTINVGQTEQEIAEKLAQIIKSLGSQGLAFESIIASGPNSGKPHHFTSDRRLAIKDILLLDFGAKFQDYCADFSRTIFIGKASDRQRNIFNHVLKAQKTAINKISHGSKSHEIHRTASDFFKNQKLEKYFLHGLGHGIGLEVHENPHLRPAPTQTGFGKAQETRFEPKEEVLLEGMVFSVEPGLYFPWGGVRIEDLVVLQNGKARVLGKLTSGIIETG